MDLARAVASSYSQEKDPLVGFVLPPDNSGVVADIGFGTPPECQRVVWDVIESEAWLIELTRPGCNGLRRS